MRSALNWAGIILLLLLKPPQQHQLYCSVFNEPFFLAVRTPDNIEPEMLSAVRDMSISASIETRIATTVISRPMMVSTATAANVALPPTPAMPNEVTAITAITG